VTKVVSTLALVLLAALAAAPVFASDITLTASTSTGVMYGLAKELVYNTSTFNGNSYTESELDWGIQPLFYTKAVLALATADGFAASLDIRMGIPGHAGQISDSDWLNYDKFGTSTLTNYSQHDCFTERAILLDAQVGWQFPLASWITLEPFLAFGFMDFKWTARDGYLQYPPGWFGGSPPTPYPDSSIQPKVPISGTGIIYQQTYFIPAVGCAAKISFGQNFGITASFAFSPLVFCNDVDNHLLAKKDFYENMWAGYLLEPKVSLDWQVTGRAGLSLEVSFRHITGLIGTTNVVPTGVGLTPGQVSGTYVNGAGAAFDALDASLNILWTL
jgi:outer membrane protease